MSEDLEGNRLESVVNRELILTEQVAQPLSIIEKAIDKGIDADTMAKLVELQERIQRNQAEEAFNVAMLAFQQECPTVQHDKAGDQDRYTYATLPQIVETIKPVLAKHGLTFSFDSTTTELEMTIVCIISHVAGHSRRSTIAMGICGTRAMSKPQMAASALTYGRRFALCAALGIVTADSDDDAQRVRAAEPAANPSPRREPAVPPRHRRREPDTDGLPPTPADRLAKIVAAWKAMPENNGKGEPDLRDWIEQTFGIPCAVAMKASSWSEAGLLKAEELIASQIPF